MPNPNHSAHTIAVTEENRIRRVSERGTHDRETIYSIIDANYIAHVGFVVDGNPVVIPMAHWRMDDDLYLHSANKGRFAEACKGAKVCVSIASLDGLVLARSAFHHSMNYRSVVIHGVASEVNAEPEKMACLKGFMDWLFPGRWEELRPVRQNELRSTVVLRVPLESVSAKAREGDPADEPDDLGWPAWAGVIPFATVRGAPLPDPTMAADTPVPPYLFEGR